MKWKFWLQVLMLGVCLGAVLVAKSRLRLFVENDGRSWHDKSRNGAAGGDVELENSSVSQGETPLQASEAIDVSVPPVSEGEQEGVQRQTDEERPQGFKGDVEKVGSFKSLPSANQGG